MEYKIKIFVTGGTGSLGSRFIKYVLNNIYGNHQDSCEFIVFSRDEQKQYQMRLQYKDNPLIHFVIGDVRDYQTVKDAMTLYKPDIVIHTAAQKHILICDQNPEQAVLTNIHGTENVARASIETGVKTACYIGTDKAVDPTTLYGMTKHIAERIWVNAKNRQDQTKFVGVRYGNVINSAGSLLPYYLEIAKHGKPVFTLTDRKMTRFFITFDQAIRLILNAVNDVNSQTRVHGIEFPELYSIDQDTFYIPKLPAARIEDIAQIFAKRTNGSIELTGEYPSEKFDEVLVRGYSSGNNLMSKKEVEELLKQENLLP